MSIIRVTKDSAIYITLPYFREENIISLLRNSPDPFKFYSNANVSRSYFEEDYESEDTRTYKFVLKESIVCFTIPSNSTVRNRMALYDNCGINGYTVTLFNKFDYDKLRLVGFTCNDSKSISSKRKRIKKKNNDIILNI